MAEREFRDVLGERHIVLYHATRLLPHEVTAVRLQGLQALTEEGRHLRLNAVVEHHGNEIGTERLEALKGSGPLSWDELQRSARLGVLYAVTPLGETFADAGSTMTVFLENWGGESFYWTAKTEDEVAETISELTRRSLATIAEFAIPASWLDRYQYLWQIFAGQLGGWDSPCGEFRNSQNIPPEYILDLVHEASPRWPKEIGPLVSPQDFRLTV